MHCRVVAESAVSKRADFFIATRCREHKEALLNYVLQHEIDLMRIDESHRRVVSLFLKGEVTESLDTFTGVELEEKNMWAAFRQVGPIPAVSQDNVTKDDRVLDMGMPFKALFWPYQGSKIWDWMKGARPEDVLPKLKKSVPTLPSKPKVKPLPINESLPTPPSEPSSEVSTPRSVSPFELSSSAASSDSEDTSAPSSASSDSGFGSETSGSTTKKLKKYKVFTAEEIEKRDKIVEEWKKKIQASLLA